MSDNLDAILALAANYEETTVTLSPESLAVLYYALPYLSKRFNWIGERPGDEVTDAEWYEIEDLVDIANRELMEAVQLTPIGATMMWITDTPPEKWVFCNGQSLLVDDYPELFEVLGYIFGGSGANFSVPNMTDKSPMGAGGFVGLPGASAGTMTHTLTQAQMPIHNHNQNIGNSPAYQSQTGTGRIAYQVLSTVSTVRVATDEAGSGQPHNNLHPVMAWNFIICAGR